MYIFFMVFSIALCIILLSGIIYYKLKLNHQIKIDDLTGLLTSKEFIKSSSKRLSSSNTKEYSLVSLDINSYRYITEAFGQEKGKKILAKLGQHFKNVAPKKTLIARNYSDNFSFLIKATFLPIIEDIVCTLITVPENITQMLPPHFKLEFSVGRL